MSTAPQAVYVPYKTLRQERCFITATEVAIHQRVIPGPTENIADHLLDESNWVLL